MPHQEESKPTISIPFTLLPEGRFWEVGRSYRVKAVLRQVTTSELGASFELVDATSLEPEDKGKRHYLTDGGYTKG